MFIFIVHSRMSCTAFLICGSSDEVDSSVAYYKCFCRGVFKDTCIFSDNLRAELQVLDMLFKQG